MTIKVGGLGQEISCYCPVCSVKMIHRCIATLGTGSTIRYAYQCDSCELELKSDSNGNAKLLKEMENV
jgi:predicted RNA-binding Zn-ribbon protein involved in translation (DUF1610 family)